MSEYGWIITKDLIESHSQGITGPRNITFDVDAMLEGKSGKAQKFRMLDGDGIIYYEGWITGDYDGFEPLDDYGMPNAGCCEIQYLEQGSWVIL